MENPSTHQPENPIVTAEVSTFCVQSPTVTTTSTKTDWVKSAVHLSRLKQRGEFSAYQLGESKKPYRPPVYLTRPDPEPPILRPRNRKGPNPHISAAKIWYRDWKRRDWDAMDDFFKAADPDEQPSHPIIQILENP